MKIAITMIFLKESRTNSQGRRSHINVTHWHSTRLTGDKTKTNVTDCHDDDAYTVNDRDGAALIDSDQDNDEPFEESEDRLVECSYDKFTAIIQVVFIPKSCQIILIDQISEKDRVAGPK